MQMAGDRERGGPLNLTSASSQSKVLMAGGGGGGVKWLLAFQNFECCVKIMINKICLSRRVRYILYLQFYVT